VWLHHFFTMGASAGVNAFFGMTSMIIAVPTGVKVFNWLFTMYGGRVRFTVPVLWTIGFMVSFVFGGLTGVLLALPAVDWQLHNSVFLIAHFHHVIIPGVLFGCIAGYNYWFPKAFGFKLDERWGKAAFWCWFIGFHLAFMPLYVTGLMGMTRRLQHYDVLSWQPFLLVAEAGAFIILAGIICQIVQLAVSIRHREKLRDTTGDPWNGRTLEWSTASPPPAWNFAVLPRGGDIPPGSGISCSRTSRIPGHDCVGSDAPTQRISFRVLHAGRQSRAARDDRTGMACSHDGSTVTERVSGCRGAPPALLLPVLARARHHLGPDIHHCLSDGSPS